MLCYNMLPSVTSHYTALHLHYVASLYAVLPYATSHHATLHYIILHHSTLHSVTLYNTMLCHYTFHHPTLCYINHHCFMLPSAKLRSSCYTTPHFHHIATHYSLLNCLTFLYQCYPSLSYLLSYPTLSHISLHYTTILYLILHSAALLFTPLHRLH